MLALIRFTFRWSLRLLAVALVLVGAAVIFRDTWIREWLLFRLRTITRLDTQLDRAALDWRTGTLALENLRIRNSPEFGDSILLSAPSLKVDLDTAAWRHGTLRFREVSLHLAEASAVRSVDGRTNFFELLEAVKRNGSPLDLAVLAPPGFSFGGIDTLRLTLGTLHLVDLAPPGFRRSIALQITNEVLHQVQAPEDLHPLILRVLIREITAGISAELRTNSASPRSRAPLPFPPAQRDPRVTP